MRADRYTAERTVIRAGAVVGTVTYGALDAFVCVVGINVHIIFSFVGGFAFRLPCFGETILALKKI